MGWVLIAIAAVWIGLCIACAVAAASEFMQ